MLVRVEKSVFRSVVINSFDVVKNPAVLLNQDLLNTDLINSTIEHVKDFYEGFPDQFEPRWVVTFRHCDLNGDAICIAKPLDEHTYKFLYYLGISDHFFLMSTESQNMEEIVKVASEACATELRQFFEYPITTKLIKSLARKSIFLATMDWKDGAVFLHESADFDPFMNRILSEYRNPEKRYDLTFLKFDDCANLSEYIGI